MSKPPSLKNLSPLSVIDWIVESASTRMNRIQAYEFLYWGLRDGLGPARADIVDADGNTLKTNQSIPKNEWKQIQVKEFQNSWEGGRIQKKPRNGSMPFEMKYYENLLIKRKDLEDWFFPKKIETKICNVKKCEKWLTNKAKELAKKPKSQWFEECKSSIECPDLSYESFKQMWSKVAMDHPGLEIGKPGRKSKSVE